MNPHTTKTLPWLALVTCSLSLATLMGCTAQADVAGTAGSAGKTPTPSVAPVTVTTVRATSQDVPVLVKATGTVTPLASVDVKAQVNSVVNRVHIQEGQFVKAGELLFTLDMRADEANVAKAKAQLAKDNAGLADAQRQFSRAQQLLAQNFISQGALDTSQAQVDALAAALAADQAAVDAAKVALSYGRVVAPSAGRAGVITVSAGSSVQANLTTLVTITQLDPIAVAFSLPQRYLPDALMALKEGGAPVSAELASNAGRFNGRLKFVDNTVDASSGAIKVKALFDNRDNKLWPGAFVEMSQTVSTLKSAVVVPQAAIIQNARGSIVYVVEDGKAALKPVQVVYAAGNLAAVTGIQLGDAVVLDGRQNLRPGTPVVERPTTALGPAKAASAAAAA